ncbi:hypothetical protein TAMA11512_04350 [Selenomonas sp. TAMA-11512]|uniref:O-antigen ligase family protein n=1 Tax=Selenomonas sp. TAMA-11512 TaxID=3095337 RepID=UPI003085D153|nr:hypothetical protein TAMA11512_04350 [Selenomonas sp. TAMA-11512]
MGRLNAYETWMTIALGITCVGSLASTALFSAGSALLLAIFLFRLVRERRLGIPAASRAQAYRMALASIAYLLLLLIPELITGTYDKGAAHLISEIKILPILLLSLMYIRNFQQVRVLLFCLTIAMLYDHVLSYGQFLGGDMLPKGEQDYRAFYINVILIVFPFTTILLRHDAVPMKEKMLFGLMGISSLVVIFGISQLRAGWGALACMLFLWMLIDRVWRKQIFAGMVVISLCFAVYASLSPTIYQRILSVTDPSWTYNMNRVYAQTSTLHIISDYPIVGIGVGNFKEVYNSGYHNELEFEHLDQPHNWILHLTVEHGLIGLLGLCLFYGYILYRCLHMYRSSVKLKRSFSIALILAIAASLIMGMFDVNMMKKVVFRVMYIMAGITLAVDVMDEEELQRASIR